MIYFCIIACTMQHLLDSFIVNWIYLKYIVMAALGSYVNSVFLI